MRLRCVPAPPRAPLEDQFHEPSELRKSQSSCAVSKIKNPETNQVETHPSKISDIFALFYKRLYKAKELTSKEEKKFRFFETSQIEQAAE